MQLRGDAFKKENGTEGTVVIGTAMGECKAFAWRLHLRHRATRKPEPQEQNHFHRDLRSTTRSPRRRRPRASARPSPLILGTQQATVSCPLGLRTVTPAWAHQEHRPLGLLHDRRWTSPACASCSTRRPSPLLPARRPRPGRTARFQAQARRAHIGPPSQYGAPHHRRRRHRLPMPMPAA